MLVPIGPSRHDQATTPAHAPHSRQIRAGRVSSAPDCRAPSRSAATIPFNAEHERFAALLASDFGAFNLAAMPTGVIESELFGHVRRAFTGAAQHRPGLFERCTPHGAVFLDEIGEVDPSIQVKLLRVLQSRSCSRGA